MALPPRYISVALPTPIRSTFQYLLAENQQAQRGSRVLVPFGSRKLVGVVTSEDDSPEVQNLRTVLDVLESTACLPESILELCEWASNYYEHPLGEVIANALPTLLRKGGSPLTPVAKLHATTAGIETTAADLKRAPAQQALLEKLRHASMTKSDLDTHRFSSRTIKVLREKGWATWETEAPASPGTFTYGGAVGADFATTREQQAAVAAIGRQGTFLLQGVTGSGKTEVYLRVIEPLLQAGKQVLVLVPEIGLTPQTIARFKDRFNVPVAVLHSSLAEGERAMNWVNARAGAAGIILGTRSAVFTPLANPGAIIVDEEHDASYKQQDGFRYSARNLAVLRGQLEKVPVVLGSATPSLESLHNVETGKYQQVLLTSRPPGTASETYELLDTRHLEKIDGFTRALRARIAAQLSAGNQVLVFLNRRGFAPVMMCNECSWIAQCRRCDARLTYHLALKTLVCHHCGSIDHNVISCQSCQSSRVAAVGLGTQRIEQTLKQLFPGTRVLRIDRDSTRRKGAIEAFIDEINAGEPAILVGTQLLAKGHHFPNVTLVALLDIDAGFYSTDFRTIEKLGQLILQVGGRAGRADKPGSVFIQSEFASHPLLQTLIEDGYFSFAQELLRERHEYELPPYAFSALLRAEHNSASLAREFLEDIARDCPPHPPASLLGPVPALMEKKAGRFRQILVLSSSQRSGLHTTLRRMIDSAEAHPLGKKVRWAVDVDPIEGY